MASQVEGWDEVLATIKRKETPLKKRWGGGVGGEEIGQKKIKGNKKLCNLELSNI